MFSSRLSSPKTYPSPWGDFNHRLLIWFTRFALHLILMIVMVCLFYQKKGGPASWSTREIKRDDMNDLGLGTCPPRDILIVPWKEISSLWFIMTHSTFSWTISDWKVFLSFLFVKQTLMEVNRIGCLYKFNIKGDWSMSAWLELA